MEQAGSIAAADVVPLAVPAEGGEGLWWAGALAVIRATSEETAGRLALIEVTEPAGAGAPWHLHHNEDEGFWVLDGNVTFEVGEQVFDAGTGDFVFGPRDVPHRYTVGEAGCRLLFILTPGGFEHMVRKMSTPALDRALPPESAGADGPDMDEMAALMAAHGLEVLDG
jgi:quercetin dioxygenase-like cupin family protein